MKLSRFTRKGIVAAAVAAAIAAGIGAAAIFGVQPNDGVVAQAATSAEKVDELFNAETKEFSGDNLKDLARHVGYYDIDDLISHHASGSVMNAAGLASGNEWVVTLGGLEWCPVYLSTATGGTNNGNVILTLWLASTLSANSGNNVQEVSMYSSGSADSNTHTYTEFTDGVDYNVYANTYSGSYIRNYILNGKTSYAQVGSNTPPAAEKLTKFTAFTEGDISQYVVAPKDVAWQMGEASHRNDPSWSDQEHYPNGWTKDKIWLPSIREADNNQLWNTSANQRSNTNHTWLRSGNFSSYHMHII